ncbi:MAG: hypothetical protein AAF514_12160 [Verrucomicrobiota bacterium]
MLPSSLLHLPVRFGVFLVAVISIFCRPSTPPVDSAPSPVRTAPEGTLEDLTRFPESPEAIARMVAFLEQGKDQPTGNPFLLNSDGTLKSAPTLRILILDRLSHHAPQIARPFLEEVCSRKTDPDEWALSLNHLRLLAHPSHLPGLTQQAVELVSNPDWQKNPTAGYLEAFDFLAISSALEAFETVATIHADPDPDPATQWAAFLALDRMTSRQPERFLPALAKRKLQLPGEITAGLLAKSDVRRPAHLAFLEAYLSRTDHAPGELETFSKLFPLHHQHVRASFQPQSPDERRNLQAAWRIDRATLTQLDDWQASRCFTPNVAAALANTSKRLKGWLALNNHSAPR